MPLIAEVYPDARFVHIIRDGRDVARSIVAQPWGPATVKEAAKEWGDSVAAGRAAAPRTGRAPARSALRGPARRTARRDRRLYAHIGLDGGIDEALAAAGQKANVTPRQAGESALASGATRGAVATGVTSSRRQATSCESWATTNRMR